MKTAIQVQYKYRESAKINAFGGQVYQDMEEIKQTLRNFHATNVVGATLYFRIVDRFKVERPGEPDLLLSVLPYDPKINLVGQTITRLIPTVRQSFVSYHDGIYISAEDTDLPGSFLSLNKNMLCRVEILPSHINHVIKYTDSGPVYSGWAQQFEVWNA